MKLLISLLALFIAANVQGGVVYSGWTKVGTYIKVKVDSTCVIDGTDTTWTTAHRIMIGSQHEDSTAATVYTAKVLIADSAALRLLLAGGTMSGGIDMGDQDIINAERVDCDTLFISGDYIEDFTGDGLSVSSNKLVADLGVAIVTGEITDGTITEPDLNITNAPTGLDNYLLSLNEAGGNFTWVAGSTDSALVAQYAHVSDSLNLAARLTGPTFTGDVTLDDGVGASPTLWFTGQDDNVFGIWKETAGLAGFLTDHNFVFRASGDNDDYLSITTAANKPTIGTVGACDLNITASSGNISFDDDLVTMKAWKWYTGGNAGGTYDSTDAPANGDQLTWNTGGTVDWQAAGGGAGEANTASDAGAGFQITHPKAGVDLPFKTFTGGNAITLDTNTANQLNFAFDGGASPAGELGGTWASPTIDDLFIRIAGDSVGGTTGLHHFNRIYSDTLQGLLWLVTTLRISGQDLTDLVGCGLENNGGVLQADTAAASELKAALDLRASKAGETWTGVHDAGGATSFEIPNSDNPTVDANGEAAWENDDNCFRVFDGTNNRAIPTMHYFSATLALPKNLYDSLAVWTILPVRGGVAPFGIHIDSLWIETDNSSTYSVIFEEWSAPQTETNDIDTIATSTSYTAAGVPSDADIATGGRIKVRLPATTGTKELIVGGSYYIKTGN